MQTSLLGIIGGTSVHDPAVMEEVRVEMVSTQFGEVSVSRGMYLERPVVFISRHGQGHAVPPHRVNYRANVMALKNLGVTEILATASVGSLNSAMRPGDLVIPDQFIDFTRNRDYTFYDGEDGVVHVDMTEPYCPRMRGVIGAAVAGLTGPVHTTGTYVCTEGPRFETPAEIRAYRTMGGDLVGMTNVPEVILAREAEMCYATVAVVTNFAAGLSTAPLTHREVMETMARTAVRLRQLMELTVTALPGIDRCGCREALKELGQF